MNHVIAIGDHQVGDGQPCYIVAEIGSNFDGDLDRALALAQLAKDCGAQAAKFQSFVPAKIVRPEGFAQKESFQAAWDKPVDQVYRDAMFPPDWHRVVRDHCAEIGIDFFSSPYDRGSLSLLDELGVPAQKIGSGEIDNLSFLRDIAATGTPVILATGASTIDEVADAVAAVREGGCEDLILLQCTTNYPSKIENAEIRAMVEMGKTFDVPVGYSDHSPGHLVATAAVTLGACMIEKHFTDDTSRKGPDHSFAMDADAFREMVQQIRLVEEAMGTGVKRVGPEEETNRVLQRRGIWFVRDCAADHVVGAEDVDLLRPARGLHPGDLPTVLGSRLAHAVPAGTPVTAADLTGGRGVPGQPGTGTSPQ